MSVDARIRRLGLTLPDCNIAPELFAPYTLHNGVLIVSGQLPMANGTCMFGGKVPDEVSIADAQNAAILCTANILGWVNHATRGNLEKVSKVVRLGGFVATSEGYADAPAIINAASNLINQIFGEKGRHARVALGVASLPFDAPVEIEATFILDMMDE